MKRWIEWAVGLAACSVLVGCGGGNDLPVVPVEGVVTFSGNPPPKDGYVVFSPIAGSGIEGLPNRPGRARFGADGRFEATTFEKGDGLLPGKYSAKVICFEEIANGPAPAKKTNFVPSTYQPPEVVVEKDNGPVEVNFDVPPNPKKR